MEICHGMDILRLRDLAINQVIISCKLHSLVYFGLVGDDVSGIELPGCGQNEVATQPKNGYHSQKHIFQCVVSGHYGYSHYMLG